jgi:hypothetical protein
MDLSDFEKQGVASIHAGWADLTFETFSAAKMPSTKAFMRPPT